jgi:exopolysaccharide production protein ExoQ
LFLFFKGIRKETQIHIGGMMAIVLAFFMLASTTWSIVPSVTFARASLYITFVLGTIGVAKTLEITEFMEILGGIAFWSALISIVLLLISPSRVVTPELGDFRGVFAHKNEFGEAMVMGALAIFHLIRANKGSRGLNSCKLFIVISAAVMARATASTLAISIIIVLNGLIYFWSSKNSISRVFAVFGVFVLISSAILITCNQDLFFESIGKDPTLTGRTELWSLVMLAIYHNPLMGWGFGAFWSLGNPVAIAISEKLRWTVPQAHDSLLEMLLEIGVIGTFFFVAITIRYLILTVGRIRLDEPEIRGSLLCCIFVVIFVGIGEAVLTDPFNVFASTFFVMGNFVERAVHARSRRGARRRVV